MARPSFSVNPLKFITKLEPFDGDKNDLYQFVRCIDRIRPILEHYDDNSQLLFGDMIKSRLKGKAREVIEINCHATKWPTIRQVLMNNFGESRNCEDLFDDMRSTKFKTNSLDFYNEIKAKLRTLNNKTVNVLGSNEAADETCRNNRVTALNIFKSKLAEPMKTILACRNPDSLEVAIEILCESGYADYNPYSYSNPKRNSTNSTNYYNNRNQNRNTNNNNNNNVANNQPNTFNNNRNTSNPNRNINNDTPNRNGTNRNSQPYRNATNRPSPNNQQVPNPYAGNNFRENQNRNYQQLQPAPEPMDVNHNEIAEDSDNQADDQNFHLPASDQNSHSS